MLFKFFILTIILVVVFYILALDKFMSWSYSIQRKHFFNNNDMVKDKYLESQLFPIKNMHNICQTKRTVNFYIGRHGDPFYTESRYSEVVLSNGYVRVVSYEVNYELLLKHIPCDILKEISIRKQKMGMHRYRRNYTRLITELGESSNYIVREKEKVESQLFVGEAISGDDEDECGIPKVYHIRLFESSDCLDRFNSKIDCSPYGCRCK